MVIHIIEQKTKVVESYLTTGFIFTTHRKLSFLFNCQHTPCAKTVLRLDQQFVMVGYVLNKCKGRSRRKSKKAADTIRKKNRAHYRKLLIEVHAECRVKPGLTPLDVYLGGS